MARADYEFSVHRRVHVIDLNQGGMSVTNDAETVIDEIAAQVPDLHQYIVTYKDSAGQIDRLLVDENNKFAGFAPGIGVDE